MPGGKPPGKQPRPGQEVELEKSGRVQVIMLRGVLFLPRPFLQGNSLPIFSLMSKSF